jgi:hypothetical protein
MLEGVFGLAGPLGRVDLVTIIISSIFALKGLVIPNY